MNLSPSESDGLRFLLSISFCAFAKCDDALWLWSHSETPTTLTDRCSSLEDTYENKETRRW